MKELISKLVLGMIVILSVIAFSIESPKSSSQIVSYVLAEKRTKGFDHWHSIYDSLLKEYVHDVRVDS